MARNAKRVDAARPSPPSGETGQLDWDRARSQWDRLHGSVGEVCNWARSLRRELSAPNAMQSAGSHCV